MDEEKPRYVLEVQDVYATLDCRLIFAPQNREDTDDGKNPE